MRRYIEDYVNPHDVSVCEEIMTPDYVVHIGGRHLAGRDDLYIPAAAANFVNFPDLHLVVHEVVTNGDRFAFRFTEIGTHLDGAACRWAGIGVYRWDGTRLVENFVEQDHLSREAPARWRRSRSRRGRRPRCLVGTGRAGLGRDRSRGAGLARPGRPHGRGRTRRRGHRRLVVPWPVALPVVGRARGGGRLLHRRSRAAAHVRLVGTAEEGAPGELNVALIAAVEGEQVVRVHAVTDRIDLANRLAGLAR